MSKGLDGCAVCGAYAAEGTRMSKVVVEGRALELCRLHTATVVAAMPETFEDLRELFVGTSVDLDLRVNAARANDDADHRSAIAPAIVERRSPIGRRAPDDRRVFPPRPEGRRRSSGRRAGDPRE